MVFTALMLNKIFIYFESHRIHKISLQQNLYPTNNEVVSYLAQIIFLLILRQSHSQKHFSNHICQTTIC